MELPTAELRRFNVMHGHLCVRTDCIQGLLPKQAVDIAALADRGMCALCAGVTGLDSKSSAILLFCSSLCPKPKHSEKWQGLSLHFESV